MVMEKVSMTNVAHTNAGSIPYDELGTQQQEAAESASSVTIAAATSLIGATKTIYTQRSRKDGDNGAWTMGVESYNRVEIVHNIMETIERKHGWESEEAEDDGLQQLLQYGRIHIYTITYDVLDSSEPV
jgi:hypothetical protein